MPSPVLPCDAFLQVREDVHLGRVPPQEEWLVRLLGALHEVDGFGADFLVEGLHPLLRERPGVLTAAVGERVHDAARAEVLLEVREVLLLRVVGMLGLFFRVQVVEVAEELVEAVIGREHLVAIAEMVLAELAGHVAVVLEQAGDGRVLDLHALGCARQADLGQAGPDRRLAGDERRATGGAALLAVPVGEQRAFAGDAVDVGRLVAHHAAIVGADVELADVVAPENEDVRFLRCHGLRLPFRF